MEDYYGKALFEQQDFHHIAEQLAGIRGRFILSLNDVPEVIEIFNSFKIKRVTCRYSCSRTEAKQARELLITNF